MCAIWRIRLNEIRAAVAAISYCSNWLLYREGTLKVGDRVLAANGVSLMQRTLSQALSFLRDVPDDEVAFLVEYDVSVLGQCEHVICCSCLRNTRACCAALYKLQESP